MAKLKPVAVLAIVAVLAVVVFMIANSGGGTFSVTGQDCDSVRVLDDSGKEMSSFDQFRSFVNMPELTDKEIRDAGIIIENGIVVQTGFCPQEIQVQ